jgi:CPA2 family monovalent cation:H+ antiporter-2
VYGDAGSRPVLAAAGIAAAAHLVVAGADLPLKMRICTTARQLNPELRIHVGVVHPAEGAWMREFGADTVIEEGGLVAAQLHRAVVSPRGHA